MMNFCTYFDSYYLLKGLALYKSLEQVSDDFHLYVMAFDRDCYDKLQSFDFKYMTVNLWSDYETPELLAVKPTRTKAEYCWTSGPSVIWHFLKKYDLPDVTYLDSDLYFMCNPKVIYDEIGDASVAITEQGLNEEGASLYGKYCVQYMFFKNDDEGCKTLAWWRDRCIEWCYQRFEDDKYGDQKYLDHFPELSPSLCVISNPSVGIAPWNMHKFSYDDGCIVKDGKKFPFVFYHMHGIMAVIKDSLLTLCSTNYKFNKQQITDFLMPYAELNMEVLNTYLDKSISSCHARGIGKIKEIEYKIRYLLRDNKLIQWLYYRILKVEYKGHGQKF